MKVRFSKYPSIRHFKEIVKEVEEKANYLPIDNNGYTVDYSKPLPVMEFTGTEKLHGTNSAIAFNSIGDFWLQSRNRIITLDNDNAGFCFWAHSNSTIIDTLIEKINLEEGYCYIYGEWCGGNIQSGVALNKLPKQFVIFGVKTVTDEVETWMPSNKVSTVFKGILPTVFDLETYSVIIDFNNPQEAVDKMENITNKVEEVSPFALNQGVSGIGEGVVWQCNSYMFKVKGSKHSVSKTNKLIPIYPEKANDLKDLIDIIVTQNRLHQGLCFLSENNMPNSAENFKSFLMYIKDDCIKEEMDTIIASGLTLKDVISAICRKAKSFYFNG